MAVFRQQFERINFDFDPPLRQVSDVVFEVDADEFDKPVKRTRQEYPYSYDGFIQWRGGMNEEVNGTIYSDRLLQWDFDKHDELCMKHFGNEHQGWRDRNPKRIEAFLRDWVGDQSLKLIFVMEYCNVSNGYPCWRFDYHKPTEK